MTKYAPVGQDELDAIAIWESNPHLNISYPSLKECIFQMAHHIRNLHDTHEKAFQAGVDYQKAMEKQR